MALINELYAPTIGFQLGVKNDLYQQISQLFAERLPVIGLDRLHHLVGFFDQIRQESLMGLGTIPGTSFGGAQNLHECAQPFERGQFFVENAGFQIRHDGRYTS